MAKKRKPAEKCELYHSQMDLDRNMRMYNYHVYSPLRYMGVMDITHLIVDDVTHLVNVMDRNWADNRPVRVENISQRFEGTDAEKLSLEYIKDKIREFCEVYQAPIRDCGDLEHILDRKELWEDE